MFSDNVFSKERTSLLKISKLLTVYSDEIMTHRIKRKTNETKEMRQGLNGLKACLISWWGDLGKKIQKSNV